MRIAPNVALLAQETVRVLNRDGWCKGALTLPGRGHCLIGAARAGARELEWSRSATDNTVRSLARKVWAVAVEQALLAPSFEYLHGEIRRVEHWNDSQENDEVVRLVLEKIAAG